MFAVVVSAPKTASGPSVRVCVHVEIQERKILGLRSRDDRLLARLPAEILLRLQPRLGHVSPSAWPIRRRVSVRNLLIYAHAPAVCTVCVYVCCALRDILTFRKQLLCGHYISMLPEHPCMLSKYWVANGNYFFHK